MPKIFFCGDSHKDFTGVIESVQEHKPDAIVLLGDLQLERPLDVELSEILDKTEIWFIPGNHDTDCSAYYDNLFCSKLAHRNLHGRVCDVAGVRIAGLGGVFRETVWFPPEPANYDSAESFVKTCGKGNHWREGLPLKHRSTIFPADYLRMSKLRADVLATHEAPTPHPRGVEALQTLAQSMHVTQTFHGHHHDCLDYSEHWNSTGIETRGVGLCGITDLNGVCIRPGILDAQRMCAVLPVSQPDVVRWTP